MKSKPATVLTALLAFSASGLTSTLTYNLHVVASTGTADSANRIIDDLDTFPSINDRGIVAFIGRHKNKDGVLMDNLYTGDFQGHAPIPLMDPKYELPNTGSVPWQTLGAPQINNNNLVLSRRYLTPDVTLWYDPPPGIPTSTEQQPPLTYLELWAAGKTGSPMLAEGADPGLGLLYSAPYFLYAAWNPSWGSTGPSPFQSTPPYWPYDAFQSSRNDAFPAVNDSNAVVFCAYDQGRNVMASPGLDPSKARVLADAASPRLSNDGQVIFADNGNLWDSNPSFSAATQLGGGFTQIGRSPAISKDGRFIVYYGVHSGKVQGGPGGPGVYCSFFEGDSTIQIASTLKFKSFDLNAKICANNNGSIVFMATQTVGSVDRKGVFCCQLTVGPSPQKSAVSLPSLVIRVGNSIPSLGTVADLSISDSLNNRGAGDVAIWCSTTAGDGIVVAQPKFHNISVDRNRDGIVSFEIGGPDETKTQPFDFWVNDDHDVNNSGIDPFDPDAYDEYDEVRDCADTRISNTRDLEDFSRIQLLMPSSFQPGDPIFTCKLEMVGVSESPSIHLWPATTAGLDYLSDEAVARKQIAQTGVMSLAPGNKLTIPNTYFKDPLKPVPFIFEGCTVGQCTITVTFYKNAELLAQDSVNINLREIADFYDHFSVSVEGGNLTETIDPATAIPTQYTLVKPAVVKPLDNTYILFVHGWRMSLDDRTSFAETGFKRLWQSGFRGGFGLFSWPTETTAASNFVRHPFESMENFRRSEEKAWHSAQGLRSLLNDLGASHQVYVLAHSMGVVVTSEALRLSKSDGQVVNGFISTQGAVSAGAFDQTVPANGTPPDSPDVYGHYAGGNPYFAGLSATCGRLINFYNVNDFALRLWTNDQALTGFAKPDTGAGYTYNKPTSTFQFNHVNLSLKTPVDRYRLFAYAAPSYTVALGARSGVGQFLDQVDLGTEFGFGDGAFDHSAQFYGDMPERGPYWRRVLAEFQLQRIMPDTP